MSIWDWLFPDVEMARREAWARVEAAKRRSDEFNESQKPMRDLAGRIMPLMYEAEMAGARPTKVYIPPADMDGLKSACRALVEYWNDPQYQVGSGMRILGLSVLEGPELKVE